ncbi:MAG: SDR family oxidoreductase [Phycisphaerales bacterium]|nr:SDR family oxidoreductase [Phycisphaerales bacterium]
MDRWLITGASGLLGAHVLRALRRARPDAHIHTWTGRAAAPIAPGVLAAVVDLITPDSIVASVRTIRPNYVIHTAAMTAVSDAFARPDHAMRVNRDATAVLAEVTDACGGRLLYTSTDMVFDGDAAPYSESSSPRPVSQYGRSKLAGEQAALSIRDSLVVRIPLLYGLPVSPRASTFAAQIAALQRGEALRLFVDEFRTPIWVEDAARALVALALADVTGLIHTAGPERLSRFELIQQAAHALRVDAPRLEAVSRLSIIAAEPRPADLSLDGRRFVRGFPECAPRPLSAAVFEIT